MCWYSFLHGSTCFRKQSRHDANNPGAFRHTPPSRQSELFFNYFAQYRKSISLIILSNLITIDDSTHSFGFNS